MKKVKIFSLLIAVLILALSLSSCLKLDEAKAEYAVWVDESRTEIIYLGNTYKLLEFDESNAKIPYEFSYSYDSIYVCENDVPLLLRRGYGISAVTTRDSKIIRVDYYPDDIIFWDSVSHGYRYYCIESEYEDASKLLKNYSLSGYVILKYDMETGEEIPVPLPDEYIEVINKIYNSVTPKNDIEEMYHGFDNEWIFIYACDSQYWFFEAREMIFTSSGIYLERYTDFESLYYKVPAEYENLLLKFKNEFYSRIWE